MSRTKLIIHLPAPRDPKLRGLCGAENVALAGLERVNCQACKKHLKDGSSFDNPIPKGDSTDPRYVDKMLKFFSHGMGWSIDVDLSEVSTLLAEYSLKPVDLKWVVQTAGFQMMTEKRKLIRELDLTTAWKDLSERILKKKYPMAAYGFEDPGSDEN